MLTAYLKAYPTIYYSHEIDAGWTALMGDPTKVRTGHSECAARCALALAKLCTVINDCQGMFVRTKCVCVTCQLGCSTSTCLATHTELVAAPYSRPLPCCLSINTHSSTPPPPSFTPVINRRDRPRSGLLHRRDTRVDREEDRSCRPWLHPLGTV